ncbi:MAG: sodium-independent anion transporter [Pyramidobacter sp.]|nr:sodium-independent anion transporter [Pyramidobacter sp.]
MHAARKDPLCPMLFTTLKSYSPSLFAKDVVAGLIVAIIALPLSIALALASGVGPEEGLYTAIAAGFVISALGGSTVQIAGPTAAFATIVAGIVARSGTDGLFAATLCAGALLILMGLLRLGSLIHYIPHTITTGFTAGIAVTIAIGQLKDFLGLAFPAGTVAVETMEKLAAAAANIGTLNIWALAVGTACILIQIFWPRTGSRVPGSLIVVFAAGAAVALCKLPVLTIGDLYTIRPGLPALRLPALSAAQITAALPDAFTIAVLAGIESLLSCVVADHMTGGAHRSNMELIAQGAGNAASALFGGIPATGAIARTAANIKNGGQTPVAGIVHALVLLLVLVLLMPYAALIPMPAIAAILFMVAWNMSQAREVVRLCKSAPLQEIAVLLVTFALTVIFDLVVAIVVGLVLHYAFILIHSLLHRR